MFIFITFCSCCDRTDVCLIFFRGDPIISLTHNTLISSSCRNLLSFLSSTIIVIFIHMLIVRWLPRFLHTWTSDALTVLRLPFWLVIQVSDILSLVACFFVLWIIIWNLFFSFSFSLYYNLPHWNTFWYVVVSPTCLGCVSIQQRFGSPL